MPFTPFHMGPAMLVKSVAGRHFSILAFGFAQIAMDIEPLVGMLRGADRLHGPTHTYAGAIVIGAVMTALAPLLGRRLLRVWNGELANAGMAALVESPRLGWFAAATGAFGGTLSHVALDSLMHADMAPLAPWQAGNPWLSAISSPVLHGLCVGTGVLGLVLWAAAQRRRMQASHAAHAVRGRP